MKSDSISYIRCSKTDKYRKSNFYFSILKRPTRFTTTLSLWLKCTLSTHQNVHQRSQWKIRNFFQKLFMWKQKGFHVSQWMQHDCRSSKIHCKLFEFGKPWAIGYTGHSFRLRAETALADSGAWMTTRKRQFGWKSNLVAKGYVAQSNNHKLDVAKLMNQSPSDLNWEFEQQKRRWEMLVFVFLNACFCFTQHSLYYYYFF